MYSRNIIQKIGLVAVCIAVLSPTLVFASPVIRTGEDISLREDQSVSGDFYALGGTVSNSAKINGDSYMLAGTVTANGETTADLVALAGTLEVHAPVGDDVRFVGGKAVIAGRVDGDVVVVAGELTILSTAEINGDVIFYGGSLEINAPVKGSVYANAQTFRLDSHVAKDVTITATKSATLGAHADVGGDVVYRSPHEIIRALDSSVVGKLTRDESVTLTDTDTAHPSPIPFLIMLFSGLVLRFVFANRLAELLGRTVTTFGMSALVGFSGLILLPIAIILMCVSVLGGVLGGALLCMYLLLLALSWSLAGTLLGGLISHYALGRMSFSAWWIILGTVTLYAITFIPYIGTFAAAFIVLMVFGGFLTRLYGSYK